MAAISVRMYYWYMRGRIETCIMIRKYHDIKWPSEKTHAKHNIGSKQNDKKYEKHDSTYRNIFRNGIRKQVLCRVLLVYAIQSALLHGRLPLAHEEN